MDIAYFTTGPPQLRQKLNDMIRIINSLNHVRGDQFIKVNKTPSGFSFSLSVAKLEERLRMFGSAGGGAVRKAYCATDAGAVSTINCYLDSDDSASEEVEVNCNIIGGSKLTEALPYLSDGDMILVTQVGSEWWCISMFFNVGADGSLTWNHTQSQAISVFGG